MKVDESVLCTLYEKGLLCSAGDKYGKKISSKIPHYKFAIRMKELKHECGATDYYYSFAFCAIESSTYTPMEKEFLRNSM